jgi:hypothetical protein
MRTGAQEVFEWVAIGICGFALVLAVAMTAVVMILGIKEIFS